MQSEALLQAMKAKQVEKVEQIKAMADKANDEVSQIDALAAAVKADVDASFDEGVKQNTAPGDKVLSLEEYNADLAKVVAEKDAVIKELQDKLTNAQGLADSVDAKVKAGIVAFKKEVAAKIRNANIDNEALATDLDKDEAQEVPVDHTPSVQGGEPQPGLPNVDAAKAE